MKINDIEHTKEVAQFVRVRNGYDQPPFVIRCADF